MSRLELSHSRIKLDEIAVQLAEPAYRDSVGNRIYLVSTSEGLSRESLIRLSHAAPVIVTPVGGHMVPIANARTLALLKSGLEADTEVPVLVDHAEFAAQKWRVFDALVKPLLDALDPGSAAAQLDQACLELSSAEIKDVWRGIHTTAGLAEKLQIPRLQLYRSRTPTAGAKLKTEATATDIDSCQARGIT